MQAVPCGILPWVFCSSLHCQLTTEYEHLLEMTCNILEFLQAHLTKGLMKLHRIKMQKNLKEVEYYVVCEYFVL